MITFLTLRSWDQMLQYLFIMFSFFFSFFLGGGEVGVCVGGGDGGVDKEGICL